MVHIKEEDQVKYPIQKSVLYLGTSIPKESSDGLQSVQQPLRELYPVDQDENFSGIDAIVTILPNGIQMQYRGDDDTVIWFPITSLSMCAAVKYIKLVNGATGYKEPRFVSIMSSSSDIKITSTPVIFTVITRRKEGRKILECHAFVCQSNRDALDLVQATKSADMNFERKDQNVSKNVENGSKTSNSNHSKDITVPPPFLQPLTLQIADEEGATLTLTKDSIPPTKCYFYSNGKDMVRRFKLSKISSNDHTSEKYTKAKDKSSLIDRSQFEMHPGRPRMLPPFLPVMHRNFPSFSFTLRPVPVPHYRHMIPAIPYNSEFITDNPMYSTDVDEQYNWYQDYKPLLHQPHFYVNNFDKEARKSYVHRSQSSDSDSSKHEMTNQFLLHPESKRFSDKSSKRKPFISGYESSGEESPRPPIPPVDYDKPSRSNPSRFNDKKPIRHLYNRNDGDNYYVMKDIAYVPGRDISRHPHPLYDKSGYLTHPPRNEFNPLQQMNQRRQNEKREQFKSKVKRKRGRNKYESSDSHGYMSEITNRPTYAHSRYDRPRNTVWAGNVLRNEKALSKSLLGLSGENFANIPSAYALNKPDPRINSKLKLDD